MDRKERRISQLNRENGTLCMRQLHARNLAVNGLESKGLAAKHAALYKIVIELGYKGIGKDLRACGIKKS
jgi:hypothetical protein